ncbi:MAG: immune inhibitor A [Dehalococcoidia bacterium]|nr:immune inhibitor A [Dehalococcoidia bacterium]
MGRAATGIRIAALLVLLTVAACGGGAMQAPAPTPSAAPSPTPTTTPSPVPPTTEEPPGRDLFDLAMRFRGLPADASHAARQTPYGYKVGDREKFTIINLDQPGFEPITATARLITERAYFFVEEGVQVDDATLQRIGRDFENAVYPRVTAAFGKEPSPGVDADTRISIVHAHLSGAGGYVTSTDSLPRAVAPRSNEREAVYLDASFLDAPGVDYNAVLAHELQHLIHYGVDPGEESWVNEGLSQVAAELLGASAAGAAAFLAEADTQLNDWPVGDSGVHYKESQLFFRYLLDRFGGRENAVALLAEPGDGIAGVDAYLHDFDTTFEDVFADWVVANYLDEASGPYAHEGVDLSPPAADTAGVGESDGTVHQFAADYLEVDPPIADTVLSFDGSDEVGIGIEPSDGAFWWSNAADDIDSRLTREFDLSGLTSATMRFRAWFETERGWDYAYVAASTDGGETWRALPATHTSDYDPVGMAYGPGYTGNSGGEWVDEEVDLTPFAGGKVLLRFEYVTDDAAHARGFAVDDVSIPELGFGDGANHSGGADRSADTRPWQAEGFRRIEKPLPQRFVVQLIERGDGSAVRRLELDGANRTQVVLDGPATIVVAAVTDGTTEPAGYRWTLSAR